MIHFAGLADANGSPPDPGPCLSEDLAMRLEKDLAMRLEKVPSALQQVRSKFLTLIFPEDYSYGCSYYA